MAHDVVMPEGIHRHYKGGLYRVLFLAFESTNGRRREALVVYVSMARGTINSRTLDEFWQLVVWPDGVKRRRFELEHNAALSAE